MKLKNNTYKITIYFKNNILLCLLMDMKNFLIKKNANKTVMNFLDFEKTKNSSNISEEPKVDSIETSKETQVTTEEIISKK